MDFEELEEYFNNAERELQDLLRGLLYESGYKKTKTYLAILYLLAQIKTKVNQNSREIIQTIYRQNIAAHLPLDLMLEKDFLSQAEIDVLTLDQEFKSNIYKALANIYTVAFAYSQSNGPNDLGRFGFLVQDPGKSQLVQIIGQGGKSISFKLSYYAAIVINHIRSKAAMLATVNSAEKNSLDLVIVSKNPSMHGDYCDAYTNAVFSITGKDKFFPPLYMTPNGGPPFHPHCRHSISIYDPSVHKNIKRVEKQFLNTSGKDVAKAWWQRKRQ